MSGWRQNTMDLLRDALRFVVSACVILDGIFIAVFSVWFLAEFLWHAAQWCNRVLFGGPW